MKFLVIGENVDTGPLLPPDQTADVIERTAVPSLKMLAEMEQQGTITGGVFAGERAGCAVVEADSAEELGQLLTSLPFWGLLKWNVRPLQSYMSAAERDQSVVDSLRAAAAQ